MNISKVLLGVAVGLAAGAAIGVLLAPDSGANTRSKISKKSQDYVDSLKSKFNDLVEGAVHYAESTNNDVHAMADRAKSKIVETVKKAGNYST
jgi:gas vesicle protein